jgi:hypothetical protein
MPSRERRVAVMAALALIAVVLALIGHPWVTINVQFPIFAMLAGWAGIVSLWFP